jgi:hypothetical protein
LWSPVGERALFGQIAANLVVATAATASLSSASFASSSINNIHPSFPPVSININSLDIAAYEGYDWDDIDDGPSHSPPYMWVVIQAINWGGLILTLPLVWANWHWRGVYPLNGRATLLNVMNLVVLCMCFFFQGLTYTAEIPWYIPPPVAVIVIQFDDLFLLVWSLIW